MVNYGSNSTDSGAALFRQKFKRVRCCAVPQDRKHLDTSQLNVLYTPLTLPAVNKSSPLPDVKNALRRMRNAGSRFRPK
jgi:hypothetical protein